MKQTISITPYWPKDLVAIANGRRIYKADILERKRAIQRRRLERIRAQGNVLRPCFIWVFHNESWLYHGWWLYVRTLDNRWGIGFRGYTEFIPRVMALYPCGVEPVADNLDLWMPLFAATYHHPTLKRPENSGLAVAKALVAPGGRLLDVVPYE